MDESTKKYIDGKFADIAHKQNTEQAQTLAILKKRQTMVRRFVFVCAVIMLGLLGLMFSILWKYQIAPCF